jgi:hypothetical protein
MEALLGAGRSGWSRCLLEPKQDRWACCCRSRRDSCRRRALVGEPSPARAIRAVSGSAGIAIENHQLLQAQKDLMNASSS